MCTPSRRERDAQNDAAEQQCTCSEAGGATHHCPLQDEIEVVELWEVIEHDDGEDLEELEERDQYVNLDEDVLSDEGPHKDFGRVIKLQAKVDWKRGGDHEGTLEGRHVFWRFDAGDDNADGLSDDEDARYVGPETGTRICVDVDEDGLTPVVEFRLSQFGGDRFRARATEDPNHEGGPRTRWLTVWRKFWYQVTEMGSRDGTGDYDIPSAVTDNLVTNLEDAYIKFEEATPRVSATHVGNVARGDLRTTADPYFVSDDRCPFKCHYMTLDYGGMSHETETVSDSITTATAWTMPSWKVLWPHGSGTHPWKVQARCRQGSGSWQTIADAKLSVRSHSTQPGFKKVTVDLTDGPLTPSTASPVEIELQMKVSGPSFYNGWGGGSNHIFLCTGFVRDIKTASDATQSQRGTVVHEMGHALGLVNMGFAAAGAHDAWEDTTHSHHCNRPLTECVMYWQEDENCPFSFHGDADTASCHQHLRKQDYSRSVMSSRWGS